MKYGVRAVCDALVGTMDLSTVRKFWSGQIIPRQLDLGKQVFDMIPPSYCDKADSLEFATGMVAFIKEMGYDAQVIEVLPD